MRIPGPIRRGVFLERPNRFVALCGVSGRVVRCHLANSGRLRELLARGAPVYVRPARRSGMATTHDLVLARAGSVLVSLDARLPNSLFEEQALAGRLGWLGAVSTLERSPAYGSSRLDFLVRSPRRRPLLVETKSCTRVADGTGLFPDARTARGARHMAELARAVREGYRAAVVFVVQREDAVSLRPADGDDPAFGSALREARKAGVAVRAFRCRVSLHEVALADEIPVLLGG